MLALIKELVAGRVCETVMYPDHEPISAERDFMEARALASTVSSSKGAIDALLAWAMVEVEALIRSHMGVVAALIDALDERGTITSAEVDEIIAAAVGAELLAVERQRRAEMQARAESAKSFMDLIANG